ncbi:MAG TPA: bifunctional ADP-heptose synthase [Terriglobales bacterium]
MNERSLRSSLRAMRGRRVAVVGDVILDEFLWGDATRISPEAPVAVVLLERQTWALGGAANVAANVAALGGEPVLFAVAGDDAGGEKLRQLLASGGIAVGALHTVPDRPTTVKSRVFARNKHLLRFDREDASPMPATATRALMGALRSAGKFDALVISDYAKGCVTSALVRGIASLCQQHRTPWCVDPKLTTIRYRQATVVKPNLIELEALAGVPARDLDAIRRAAARTLRRQGCQHLLVTRGQHGMALFGADGSERLFNSGGQAVADVTGAGDTVNAVLALGLAGGLTVAQAAEMANLAAGYVVTQPGTAVARPQDLLDQIK